jgi:hypothetical protein
MLLLSLLLDKRILQAMNENTMPQGVARMNRLQLRLERYASPKSQVQPY